MTPPGDAPASATRQILAISGVLTGDRSRTIDLIRYAVSLAPVVDRPAVCVGTPVG